MGDATKQRQMLSMKEAPDSETVYSRCHPNRQFDTAERKDSLSALISPRVRLRQYLGMDEKSRDLRKTVLNNSDACSRSLYIHRDYDLVESSDKARRRTCNILRCSSVLVISPSSSDLVASRYFSVRIAAERRRSPIETR